MCRLFGIVTPDVIAPPHRYVFSQLAVLSSRLGNTHGSGVVRTNTKSSGWFFKKWGEEYPKVANTQEYQAFIKDKSFEPNALFGHARLASSQFRATNGVYPTEQAHPFEVGTKNWLIHNGNFKDHRVIAEAAKIEEKELTDTMVFAKYLTMQVGSREVTADDISNTLSFCGEAEYAMLVGNSVGEVYAVVGGRELHWASSNYGYLVSTTEVNLKDLPAVVEGSLINFDFEPLVLGAITKFEPWNIYLLSTQEPTKVQSLETLKAINQPPTAVVNYGQYGHYWNNDDGYTSRHSRSAQSNKSTSLVDQAVTKAKAMLSLYYTVPDGAKEEDIVLMLQILTAKTYGYWWEYSKDDLNELLDLLNWVDEHHPELRHDKSKEGFWLDFCSSCGDVTLEQMYDLAQTFVETFVVPYWHNTVDELEGLVCSVRVL
jgi:hypothetical protein